MMRYTKRKATAYAISDDRCSGGGVKELDIRSCCGCERDVILNPDRERNRHWCTRCDSYRCDVCAQFECVPFKKLVAAAFDARAKGTKLILPARFT